MDCCKEKGILVCNIRDYAFDSVPEHTFALILALRKNILGYKKALQDGLWQESGQFCLFLEPVHCLSGSRLGIIGSGSLGQAVAKLGEAFGMDVCFAQRKFENLPRENLPRENLTGGKKKKIPVSKSTKNSVKTMALATNISPLKKL